MSRAHASPQAIVTAPLASTAARSETAPSPTNATSPTKEPAYVSRAPRRKTFGTRSIPTSSVIHASYAPLVNVYEMPHSAQSAITTAGESMTPTSNHDVPMPR
jgi:hypothetical protein